MKQARSGELRAELGQQWPNGVSTERQRSRTTGDIPMSLVEPGTRPASSARPRCVWLAPGPWPVHEHDEPEDFARLLPARRAAPELGRP